MQDNELTNHRRSDSTACGHPISCVPTTEKAQAAGIIITGPDAEDIHLIGGGE